MQKTTVLRVAVVVVVVLGLGAAALLRAKSSRRGAAAEDTAAPGTATGTGTGPASAPGPAPASPPPVPAPRPSGEAVAAPAAPIVAPPPPSEADRWSEPVLMARLRQAAGTDFPLAVRLARVGNRNFPDSADAPERASILIHALAAQEMVREARGEAEYAVNHYPDSSWVREIEGFTGAHRHRNLIVTDGGQLRYQ